MAKTNVDLPDRVITEIDRLVEAGEFLNREQAFEELLSMGVSAYGPAEETTQEPGEDIFEQNMADQTDPAARDEGGDDYTF
ncbi:CopG family transcriptional regulator [Halobacteriales archaeon QS_4_62_28]|nr:MAG: CopG family transcriptional regulator [Halobacteriales archaeon QS_4_62_28]